MAVESGASETLDDHCRGQLLRRGLEKESGREQAGAGGLQSSMNTKGGVGLTFLSPRTPARAVRV